MDTIMDMLNHRSLSITPEILSLISSIDEFRGAWRALWTLAPERLMAMRRVATIESIWSSTRIEWSRLTDREVESLLSRLEVHSFGSRDEEEVAGYADVMETVFSAWQHVPLTENHIMQLHRDLLKYSTKDEWHRWRYKTTSNSVVAFGPDWAQMWVVFETATPFDTPRLMAELVAWYREREELADLHPLLAIAIFAVAFLEIHPFQDWNWRLSRVLTTLLLLRAGYAYVPYSSLESIIEQNKQGYYLALRQTQGTIRTARPDWQPWAEFFLRALRSQVTRLKEKVERERIVLQNLPELSIEILELTRSLGRVTVQDVVLVTRANRNTVKAHIRRLVESGNLVLSGAGRWAFYRLP